MEVRQPNLYWCESFEYTKEFPATLKILLIKQYDPSKKNQAKYMNKIKDNGRFEICVFKGVIVIIK